MTRLPTRLRIVLLLAGLAAGSMLAAPPAGAGDMLDNVKDGLGCMKKAVFGPLKGFARAFEAFGTDDKSVKEGLRDADGSVKEALKECGEALENIYTRALGVEKIAARARETAALAKSAVDMVAKRFGKGAAPDDPRMALAVRKEERPFYEQETGVLGSKPLPEPDAPGDALAVRKEERRFYEKETGALDRKPLPEPDDASAHSGGKAQRRGAASASAWDGEAAQDPWSSGEDGEGSAGRNSAWDRADPWGGAGTAAAAQALPAPVADEDAEADRGAGAYAAALSEVLGGAAQRETAEGGYAGALAALERREAAARRAEEREVAQARQRTEREAARRRAERKAAQARTAAPDRRSGSQAAPRSSNCEEDTTPICRQVKATMEARLASLHTRLNAGGLSMSGKAELTAEMYKVLVDHMPACLATETRPHCAAANRRDLEEARRGYRSALETARQYRGG